MCLTAASHSPPKCGALGGIMDASFDTISWWMFGIVNKSTHPCYDPVQVSKK